MTPRYIIWAIKNTNKYIDKQLIDLFYDLTDQTNIRNYIIKSKNLGEVMGGDILVLNKIILTIILIIE